MVWLGKLHLLYCTMKLSDKLLDCSANSVQVVSDPLAVLSDSGEDGRSPYAAYFGSSGHHPHLLPGGEFVPPGHQRTATVSITAVLTQVPTSAEVQGGTEEYLVINTSNISHHVGFTHLISSLRSTPNLFL